MPATSPNPIPNPYQYPSQTVAPVTQQFTPPQRAVPPKSKSWLWILLGLVIGLILGGLGGYFAADYLVFSPQLEELNKTRTDLDSRIQVLEAQLNDTTSQVNSDTTNVTNTTTGDGTGTAPVVSGITADPKTTDWKTYSNQQYKFSFKYPADYKVETVEDEDKNVLLHLGLFRTGEKTEAGFVRVYKTADNQGPTHGNLTLGWSRLLPPYLVQEPGWAGLVNKVEETEIVVNETPGFGLEAKEGEREATTPTPNGATYSAYMFENQFDATYLVGGCSTEGSQAAQVGCLFMTTFTFLRE